jgi:hypothetical protein
MGLLSFLKGMKVEDNRPMDLTFRTSRTCGLFGALLLGTGVALGIQLCCGNPLFCYFNAVFVVSIVLSLVLVLLGVLIATYRKCVIISRLHSRVEYMESSLLCWRRATYSFDEIRELELCEIRECLFSSTCSLWTVKAYIQRNQELIPLRFFEGSLAEQAEEAAQMMNEVLQKPLLSSTRNILPHPLPLKAHV